MFKLSNKGTEFVKNELSRYESRRSAILPCLTLAQEENGGYINAEIISYLAHLMDIPESQIQEVFMFYTMYNKKPVGKFHVQVCCNISCAMNGGRELVQHLTKEFRVNDGEVTSDGNFSFSRVECLGACGGAPMMQVNEEYHENLTPEKAVHVLKNMAKGNSHGS
ncbi:MAG: NAD(P)H-dependent oxidoreductase subunit E [Pseudomonadota bacterium]|nr:NAD(P)H-dependent oxidoreductase subunit E [Pseudomonadota bacterium]